MGGGAAQLLHLPSCVSQVIQVVKHRKIHGTTKALALRDSKHPEQQRNLRRIRRNGFVVNCSVLKQNAGVYPASIHSKSDCSSIFLGGHGRAKKSRLFCSADNAPEATQISSEISPEILVSTGLNTEAFYAEAGVGILTNFQEDSPTSSVQEIEEAAHKITGDKVLASAVIAAVIVSSDTLKVQGEDNADSCDLQAAEIVLDQEILDSMENQEAAASLLGSEDNNKSLLEQMREILVFAGPALGIWLSGPLMSIIDTAVVGQSSALELAALGPGTVFCDQLSYVFMFLSVATSNLIATALAHKDEAEAAGHLSRLLFISLFCGLIMMLVTEIFTTQVLAAFVGAKNFAIIPAARTYVQIRALAWPIVLVGMVSQSASLGMKDSWGPLKVLAVASAVNLFGDILLCSFMNYGIAGAAWATMASQYIAGILMLKSLGDKGYNPLAISIPSWSDFVHIMTLAGPILLTMLSKVSFYTLITYLATSLGAMTLAAHQVMIGVFSLCTVWGEPLAQTAQSFMPALIYGKNRNLKQARTLLRTLIVIGAIIGVTLGSIAISVPWLFPQIFTSEPAIISQMRAITLPFFLSLMITPPTLSCEGTLLAGRDLKFLGFSMVSCFLAGSVMLFICNNRGVGLRGSWWTLVAFQMIRFLQSYTRLAGHKSILRDDSLAAGEAFVHPKSA